MHALISKPEMISESAPPLAMERFVAIAKFDGAAVDIAGPLYVKDEGIIHKIYILLIAFLYKGRAF